MPVSNQMERFTVIPVPSGTRQGCPLCLYLFNIVLEVLARARRQLKEIKRIQIRKKDGKVSLLTDNIIVYTNFIWELLQSMNQSSDWIQD